MNNARHVPVSETAARRVRSTKARRGRPRKNSVHKSNANENVVQKPAADETVADERITRAKGLLAATLRVWELKHRISEWRQHIKERRFTNRRRFWFGGL